MKRLDGKAIDVVTNVHRLVAAAWFAGAIGVVVLVLPLLGALGAVSDVTWTRIAVAQRVASTSSVVILVLDLLYGFATTWGFVRYRWVLAKWVLFLSATAFGGISISAARSRSVGVVLGLTAAELVVLVAALGLGVSFMRRRRAGKLAELGVHGSDT